MAERRIDVEMRSRYVGDLKDALRRDQRSIKAMQHWMDRNPLKVRVKVDMGNAKKQAAAVRAEILGDAKKGGGAGILGADGRPMMNVAKAFEQAGALISRTTKRMFSEGGKEVNRLVTDVEQLGAGLQKVTVTGKKGVLSQTVKDTRTITELNEQLAAVAKKAGPNMGRMMGRGDTHGVVQNLKAQKAEIEALMQEAVQRHGLRAGDMVRKAEQRVARIDERVETLYGREETEQQKARRSGRVRRIDNAISGEERRVQSALKLNKVQMEQAMRIQDIAQREAAVNQLYKERQGLFERSRDRFRRLDGTLQRAGMPGHADKAMRRAQGMQNEANQVGVDVAKRDTDMLLAQRRKAAMALKQEERKAEAERLRAMRRADRERRAAAEDSLKRELQDIKAAGDRRVAAINREEERALAAAGKNIKLRSGISVAASERRQRVYGQSAGLFDDLSQRASAGGMRAIALSARQGGIDQGTAAAKDMERLAVATRNSGHALDFHSNSLLRNAGTFVKWMIPLQMVMAVTGAFSAGVRDSVEVNKQFATMRAVFRGTEEEAQRLKVQTLELSAAQGRAAQEGMDASIRWSRLGMTRVQVLEATKVSLMAANVAEITAAEAAEKLSAIYATYRLNVGDLPVVLSRLNAISNRYNVTNKDLLEGIVRVAGVAKQAGLELRDLEGIIGAVTGATGRPGQEIGNALKFVITRVTDPRQVEGLREMFDIDLTDANGDLKSFSDILAELAAVFPTLNTAQKQAFLKMTAGSRQSARFALVMDQYRQAQVLAAEAAFDTSSAFEENEKILQSLQSRIDSLKASWTQLFTAMGDTGVFEILGSFFEGLGTGVSDVSKLIEILEKGAGQKEGVVGKFMNAQAERMGESYGLSPIFLAKGLKDLFTGNILRDSDESQKEEFVTELEKMTGKVNKLRERLSGLERAAGVFKSMDAAIDAGALPRETMIRDFEAGAHLLLNLENGTKLYGDALTRFYALLDKGDTKGISALFKELEAAFNADVAPTRAGFMDAQAPALKALREELVKLEKQRRDLNAKPAAATKSGLREQQEQMEELQGKIKSTQAAIEQLTQAAEMFTREGLSQGEQGRIQKYFEDLLKQAEMVKQAFDGMFGDSDPVARQFAMQRRTLGMGREILTNAETASEAAGRREMGRVESDQWELRGRLAFATTNRDNANYRLEQDGEGAEDETARILRDEAAQREKILASLNEEMNQLDRKKQKLQEADQMIKTALREESSRIEAMQRELEIAEQLANLRRGLADGRTQASNILSGAAVGPTEVSRLINQAQAALGMGGGLLERGGKLTAGESGTVLEAEATARKNLEDLERRQYSLAADRKNLEFEILEAVREQAREASKRLMMASREDQLRAAAMAKATKGGGRVSANEFMYLDQNSRQAMQNFMPDKMPEQLDDVTSTFKRRAAEIDNEIGRVNGSIGNLRSGLDSLTSSITKALGKNGNMDLIPRSGEKGPLDVGRAPRDERPVVNLNVSAVDVRVAVGQELEGIVSRIVQDGFRKEIQRLEGMIRTSQLPTAQGAVE